MIEKKRRLGAWLGLRGCALMLLLLAVPVGLSALASSAGLLRLPHELMQIDVRSPVIFRLHMISAGLALVLMPIAIAMHGRSMHKLVGRSAALLGILGGVTALPVALASEASLLARAGFFAQGVVWIGLLLLAVISIRGDRRVPHRWLMLMATAVASGAIWLRLATWAAVTTGAPFEAVYGAAAWLAWMLPAGVVALLWVRHAAESSSKAGRNAERWIPGTSPGMSSGVCVRAYTNCEMREDFRRPASRVISRGG